MTPSPELPRETATIIQADKWTVHACMTVYECVCVRGCVQCWCLCWRCCCCVVVVGGGVGGGEEWLCMAMAVCGGGWLWQWV